MSPPAHKYCFFSPQDDTPDAEDIGVEEEPGHGEAGAENLDGEPLEGAEMEVDSPRRNLDEDSTFMHC